MVNSILLTTRAAQIRDHESPLNKMQVLTLKSQSAYGRVTFPYLSLIKEGDCS